MNTTEQEFLKDLDKKLWNSADRLRSSLDAAVYKHIVLGLIFLKYASDSFQDRRQELEARFRDPNDEYYLDPPETEAINEELEVRDYYKEVNVFWVPQESRWNELRNSSKLAVGAELPWNKKMRGVSFLLDDALAALGAQNDRLKKILAADTFTRHEVQDTTISGLIDVFSNTNFSAKEFDGRPLSLKSKDILGHVYEYFLGEFAQQEGKKGGQYYTPKSIVTLIVEMLQPYRGRVFDPAMGSGGFFVQSEEFIEHYADRKHVDPEKQKRGISVYGQESNPTTWRLAAMNMAIRGLDFDFGEEPADSFLNDQHPDLRADFVMANPPFNMKEWGREKLENDPRWKYGTPPANNANFAWLQHMLYHLAPTGSLGLLLANGSMASSTSGEGEIRTQLVKQDLVECMVALPGQLFTNTQIPACIWFLTKNKSGTVPPLAGEPSSGDGVSAHSLSRAKEGARDGVSAHSLSRAKEPLEKGPEGRFSEEGARDGVSAHSLGRAKEPLEKGPKGRFSEEGAGGGVPESVPPFTGVPSSGDGVSAISLDRAKAGATLCNRQGEFLFIDARQVGYMKDRVLRDFTPQDIERIAGTFHAWQQGEGYEDVPGFCKSETLEGVQKHDFVLTPGRYVGAGATEDDGEPFAEKMDRLTKTLSAQFRESARLEAEITKNLAGLGWML